MITTEKLNEYEEFRGYYDGFYLQKGKKGKNLNSDIDWNLIKNLTQDIRLVQNNLAAEVFIQTLNKKLADNCDSLQTIEYLKMIAAKGW